MKTQQTLMLLAFLLSIAACKKESSTSQQTSSRELTSTSSQESRTAGKQQRPHIDPSDFVKGIDNSYFPLVPGTLFKYVNTLFDGQHVTVENITVTVTYDTKVILGVCCEVIHDQVKTNGKVTENTYDWYAQDKLGNVWYFGEDTKSYHNGTVDSSGSFEAGVNGALPGIIMLGNPAAHIGVQYYQEYLKGEAEDQGTVINVNSSATVAYGTFSNNCVVTEEYTRLEPDVLEYKYYAPGVGQVLTVLNKGGEEREELISISHI